MKAKVKCVLAVQSEYGVDYLFQCEMDTRREKEYLTDRTHQAYGHHFAFSVFVEHTAPQDNSGYTVGQLYDMALAPVGQLF